jgi:hypothetical protein
MAVIIAGINGFYRLSPVWAIGQLLGGIASVHHHSSDPNRGNAADLRFIKVRSRLILRSYEWLSIVTGGERSDVMSSRREAA